MPPGVLPDGTKFNGPAGLREVLVKKKDLFVETFTERLLTYALGRGVEEYDRAALRKIVRDAAADNQKWSSIILGIVKSTPFQMRRVSDGDTLRKPFPGAPSCAARARPSPCRMLDAMTPALRSRRRDAADPPGVHAVPERDHELDNEWTPKTEGANWEMTRMLEPLAAFKDRMVVLERPRSISKPRASTAKWAATIRARAPPG